METTVMLLIITIVPLFFMFGRWQDPKWRCIQLRKWTKKNYINLCIVQKDGRTIALKTVNAEKDIAIINNALWAIVGGRVYRRTETHSTKKKEILKALESTGKNKATPDFKITQDNIVFEEGAPTVYVDNETIKPLNFYKEKGTVKPEETGSAILAYVSNQLAKAIASVSSFKHFLIIIIVLLVIDTAIDYYTLQKTTEVLEIAQAGGYAPLPEGGAIENGEMIITQERADT